MGFGLSTSDCVVASEFLCRAKHRGAPDKRDIMGTTRLVPATFLRTTTEPTSYEPNQEMPSDFNSVKREASSLQRTHAVGQGRASQGSHC